MVLIEEYEQSSESARESLQEFLRHRPSLEGSSVSIKGLKEPEIPDHVDSKTVELVVKAAVPLSGSWVWFERSGLYEDKMKVQKWFTGIAVRLLRALAAVDPAGDKVVAREVTKVMIMYYYEDYPWSTPELRSISVNWLEKTSLRDHREVLDSVIESIKPLFTSHPRVSAAGRKKAEAVKNRLVPGEPERFFEWKEEHQWALAMLEYCVSNMESEQIATHWAFIVPAVLNVLDDGEILIKAVGCRCARAVVEHAPSKILTSSGVADLFSSDLWPAMKFLPPSVEPALSKTILKHSFDALLEIATVSKPDSLDLLMEEVIYGLTFANQYIEVAETLIRSAMLVIPKLGTYTVRHLQELVKVFASMLSDPFSGVYQPLIRQACELLILTIQYCWMRIDRYKYDILKALIVAWDKTHGDNPGAANKDQVALTEESLKRVLTLVQDITTIDLEPIVAEWPSAKWITS